MSKRLLAFGVMAIMLIGLALPATVPVRAHDNAQDGCESAPAPRLVLGERGRVTPGAPNNVRDDASPNGALVGSLPSGSEFDVLEGPRCGGGFYWWFVRSESVSGWTAEGGSGEYWVEPLGPGQPGTPQQLAGERIAYANFVIEPLPVMGNVVVVQDFPIVRGDGLSASPGYREVTFQGVPGAYIRLYDMATIRPDFIGDAAYMATTDALAGLDQLLDGGPSNPPVNPADLPALPMLPPSRDRVQTSLADAAIIPMGNGRGLRFVATYADDPEAAYYFLGRTSRRVMIAARLPLGPWSVGDLDGLIGSLSVAQHDEILLETTTVNIDGVTFSFDPALAELVAYRRAGASYNINDPWWAQGVSFRRFTLEGFMASGYFDPQILVYSVAEIEASSSDVGPQRAALDDVRTLLADEGEILGQSELPFLPGINAAQVFTARVQRLDFENGRGIRYLAFYSQAPVAVTDDTLVYAFIGLTDDGQWLVAATFPFQTEAFPDTYAPDQPSPQGGYVAEQQTLNQLNFYDFQPDLQTLNAVIRSIRVTDE